MSSDSGSEMNDAAFVRRAVALADLDALKVTLFHLTGDETIAALPRGADLTEAQAAMLRDRAVLWLTYHAGPKLLPDPADPDLRRMMEMFVGHPIGDREFAARRDVPGFRDYPYMVEWDGAPPPIPPGFKVIVIGSGFAGVGMAVQLGVLGIPYEVLERRADAGGVWSIHGYPDVRVDTPSSTYEFMFEKDHVWSEYYANGAQVRSYVNDVSEKFGVRARTRFDHDVRHARFDEARDLWVLDVTTPEGPRTFEANVIVSASGLYTNPLIPSFEGQDSFKGRIVHPSLWPADLDLHGKRVAIIGNGSTGVQMMGAVAAQAEQLFAFQRTPQWILPRDNYGKPIEPEIRWLLRNLPGYTNWYRFSMTAPLFETHALMTVDPEWQAQGGRMNRGSDAIRDQLIAYIHSETGGRADLIERLVPDYAPLTRRPVIDNGWYRALTRDNVELVSGSVVRLTPYGIVAEDGELREVDIIITATGFDIVRYLAPARYTGAGGVDLHDRWYAGDGPRAYVGIMVPDFPNFFMIYGPNSQPVSGGPATPAWFALWASFAARCIMRMLTTGASRAEVTQQAFDAYNEQLDQEATKLVLMSAGGGKEHNYYVNRENGRLQVNAPWYAPDFHRWCSEIRWQDLVLTSPSRDERAA